MPAEKQELQYITFILDAHKFAIELPKIKEVLNYPQMITPIPGTSPWIKGLTKYKNEIIPIIDLRVKLKLLPVELKKDTTVIAIETSDHKIMGLIIDTINDIEYYDAKLIKQNNIALPINDTYLIGSIIIDDKPTFFLDIEKIVSVKEL